MNTKTHQQQQKNVFLGCLSMMSKQSDHRLNFKTEANSSELVKIFYKYHVHVCVSCFVLTSNLIQFHWKVKNR